MPNARAIDIDDKNDLEYAKFLLKLKKNIIKMNKNYLDKFSLKNKKAYIFGGCGLIGKEITNIFNCSRS